MADIEHFSEDINQRMMDPKNNVASQGAYDIVSMAAASAVQNELAMHSGFETTSNTVLALAMQKMAEAAAIDNEPQIKIWEGIMKSISSNRDAEVANLSKFNEMTQNLVKNFPRG
ncbi:hypothetical protein [Caedibacter taeniospiralis]|uniref:RebC n=1 Tax=Caedibacter taeniospiralis TaxID=28907 RepID=Q6TFI4_CAETA|nr:hypothetical protein [Caedibacter taeniospiralis]AAR87131.1 RebC [Caedibacter taeniospiralis]